MEGGGGGCLGGILGREVIDKLLYVTWKEGEERGGGQPQEQLQQRTGKDIKQPMTKAAFAKRPQWQGA